MKEEWIIQMRQKLEEHEMTPPTGLWEAVSQPPVLTPEPVHRQTRVFRLGWMAVAATVLALVGLFLFQQSNVQVTEEVTGGQARCDVPASQRACPPVTSPVTSPVTLASVRRAAPKAVVVARDMNETTREAVSEEYPVQDAVKSIEPEAVTESKSEEYPKAETLPLLPEELWESEKPASASRNRRWAIEVNASGGLLAANASQSGSFSYSGFTLSGGGTLENIYPHYGSYNPADYVQAKWEHRLPLRFGLNLSYSLSPRMALLTGVNYTYLYSRLTVPRYPEATVDQRLHYLGVPIGLTYQLWTSGGLSLYVSGGIELDKCLDDNPWLLSVSASAGAEYTIVPQLGLYLEPSLGYYFDDGSSLQHYYKQHPLAPAIELGLRLHL